MDRLKLLVFSFYRENPCIEAILEPLHHCRMTRSWGSIRIECVDAEHLEEMIPLLDYLRLPLSSLSLGKQIVLRVPGYMQRTFPMEAPFPKDLMATDF